MACEGLADEQPCTFAGSVGHCVGGACVGTLCGNGRIDQGELCDGALGIEPGQSCRADCLKVQVCGDGLLDENEPCDDGNVNPADGCDACVATGWRASVLIGGNANALAVELGNLQGLAIDYHGNIYIADATQNKVRKIDGNGFVTILAGTGAAGFGGDGGPATSAELLQPDGIAVDGLGNLYISDSGNNRIRRVDPDGIITTFAGTGASGFSGDGGLATSATIGSPRGIAVDGLGNVLAVDEGNARIRKIDPNGIITTFAGNGTFTSSGDGGPATSAGVNPADVAFDKNGNVYIAETFSDRVRKVDPAGIITTFAGTGTSGYSGDNGPATSAKLWRPTGVDVDATGNVYIADTSNYRIRRVTAGVITTVAGNGTFGFSGDGGAATAAQLHDPWRVEVAGDGSLYIADWQNQRVRRVDAAGVITTIAGVGSVGAIGDGGAATSAQLNYLHGMAIDKDGAIYVADPSHRVRRIDPTGVITTVAGTGEPGFSGDGGAATNARLYYPEGLAVDSAGNLYISDTGNERVRRVDTNGTITTIAGTGTAGFSGDGGAATSAQLSSPAGLAVDAQDNLYIADYNNFRVRRISGGIITTVAGTSVAGFSGDGGPATSAQLDRPRGVAIDTAGALYIADTYNHAIRRVASGTITRVAGTGVEGNTGDGGSAAAALLAYPQSIAFDVNNNLYVADTNNARIRKISGGIITKLAGTTFGVADGDGGVPTDAIMWLPEAVVVDASGAVYVADSSNSRVRRIAGGIMTTIAGPIDPLGMGPLAQARLADPRALVLTPTLSLIAGGRTGTLQALRSSTSWLEVVAGRYPQNTASTTLARFRTRTFGAVSGVAHDAAAHRIYITELEKHTIHVITMVDPEDENTWTIAALANVAGNAGFADGAAATARFREPTGLYLDAPAQRLYVADTGNHAIRAIDLATNVVSTFAGTPTTLGFFGDGGSARGALLYRPQALTGCANGDIFIADTGNHRVRRVAAETITTVVGVGVPASSGEGSPATTFPVDTPVGLACDQLGNLFVASRTTVRMLAANDNGLVDGSGRVQTIYGKPPRDTFPASATSCLTGIAVPDATSVQVTDSCNGLLVELRREAVP